MVLGAGILVTILLTGFVGTTVQRSADRRAAERTLRQSEQLLRSILDNSPNEIVLKDVKTPKANLLGEVGKGFRYAMQTLDSARIGVAAQGVGIAQRALDEAKALREEMQRRDDEVKRQAEVARRKAAAEEGQRVFHEAIDSQADQFPHAFALPTRFRQSIADEIALDFKQRNGDWQIGRASCRERV